MDRGEIRLGVYAGRLSPHFASLNAGCIHMRGWEADERPEPRSLGLLPSGPDPVGEWLVHRQPPGSYIGREGGESKLATPLPQGRADGYIPGTLGHARKK